MVFAIVAAGTSSPAKARSSADNVPDHHGDSGYRPPYAAIVLDANSGRILHASNPDSLRHPASITKLMTLSLPREQLDAVKLKLHSR